ncbi:MAG: DUF423 domain-containing protein [Solirubrobacterales bacterium]
MRPWVVLAGVNGALAVGLGAWAAHGLAADPAAQALAQRASEFQLVHALALLAADRLAAEGRRLAHWAAALLTLGIALFSGSLYLKAALGTLPVPLVTPTGGLALMAGWLVLAASGVMPGAKGN